MNNMITSRLKSLTKYINKNDKIIDIGCDHALLDIYLIKNKIVDKVIVSDISNNALNQGIENIKKYNLENNIDTRCGNGLEVLNELDKIDTIIISGMGTHTILDILNNDYLKNIKKLIIQSNNDYELLRRSVVELGFIISNEETIVDSKLYINIIFERGKKEYTEEEYKYGLKSMLNKEIYYKHLINKYNKIIDNIKDKNQQELLNKEIKFLEQNI